MSFSVKIVTIVREYNEEGYSRASHDFSSLDITELLDNSTL